MKVIILFSLMLVSHFLVNGQQLDENFKTIFDFDETKMTSLQLKKKNEQIDSLWNALNKNWSESLKVLDKEMVQDGYPNQFYVSMIELLNIHIDRQFAVMNNMVNSKEHQLAKGIITKGLNQLQLDDSNPMFWIDLTVKSLRNGVDVTPVIIKLLSMDKVKFNHPQTKEEFNQSMVLCYILLNPEGANYVDLLTSQFSKFNSLSQKSILTYYYLSNSSKADEEIKSISQRIGLSTDVRQYATRLAKGLPVNQSSLQSYQHLSKDQTGIILKEIYRQALERWDEKSWQQVVNSAKIAHHLAITFD